ncbi:flagellar protein FlaG [Schinkia azotoformans]|uniref:flagellar protein FlaG n=1 Tax=Schinkia azotoformans TaxID=1454 RepID=UPI002E1E69FF|nr:flagellar protein FlaG [Schinkia azotoformans]
MKIDSGNSQQFQVQANPKQDAEIAKTKPLTNDEQQLELHKIRQEKKEKDEQQELTRDELKNVVKGLNEFLKPTFTSLNFKVHEELDRYYVEVVDQETKKVIREIPSKEILDMYAKMTEYLGLFIDKKL